MDRFRKKTSELVDDVAAPAVDSARDTLGEIIDLLTDETSTAVGKVEKRVAKTARKNRKRIPALAASTIPGVVPKKAARLGRFWGFVWGALVGAAILYLFDPEKGEQRRKDLMTTLGIESGARGTRRS